MSSFAHAMIEARGVAGCQEWVDALPDYALPGVWNSWQMWSRADQRTPRGDWRIWLIMAGRGYGKTRAGAEWVHHVAMRSAGATRIALVAATIDEARAVMVEGESGVLACALDSERPEWAPTTGVLRWASGAEARIYSAAVPDKLRGPQHHYAWCDEIAKWDKGMATWDNLMLGMRLGDRPRVLATTTPRPIALIRRLLEDEAVIVTRGRTADNAHLPQGFVVEMLSRYGGTRLGRQELNGELIEEIDGALWTRAMIEGLRISHVPPLWRVVVGVDPSASDAGDLCGIVVVGLGSDGLGYLIEDASVRGSPERWAAAVAAAALRHGADRVVAEANNGGDMVRSVLQAADAGLPITLVHAARAKVRRAEPVAVLYEQAKVRHVGAFPDLEDQLCGLLKGGGYQGPGRSPDRADALVWALTALMLGQKPARPQVRMI